MYETLVPDPRRAGMIPVQFIDRQPERIGTIGRQHCELSVHPEEGSPAATGAAPGGEAPNGA